MERTTDQSEIETFAKHQQAVDKAINERIREEHRASRVDMSKPNSGNRRDRKSDTSVKSTGGGKQSNPGD